MIIHVVVEDEVEDEAGQPVLFPLRGMINTGKLNQGRLYELLVVAVAVASAVSGMRPHRRLRGRAPVRSSIHAPSLRGPARPDLRALCPDRVRKSNESCSSNVTHIVSCY